MPHGGNSGLPYIKFGIPGVNATGDQERFYEINRTSNDDFIRGGAEGSRMARMIDQDRILAFYKDKQRGPQFIDKQVQLQLKNPKLETMSVVTNLPNAFNLPTLLENTRVYNNGVNTLAQVGVQGTGKHIVRHGLLSFGPREPYYQDVVGLQNLTNESTTNRLLLLTKLKMKTDQGFFVNTLNTVNGILENIKNKNTQALVQTTTDFALAKKLGISVDRNLLFNYPQGPGSIFGGTDTIIPRTSDTTRVFSSVAMTYDQLRLQTPSKPTYDPVNNVYVPANIKPQDFRAQLPGFDGSNMLWNWQQQLKKGITSEAGNSVNDPTILTANGKPIDYKIPVSLDKINKLYPQINANNSEDPYINNKDIIKFGFECINNDDPTISTSLIFRAFLTAGLTDNNTAQLNSFRYMGRGENFYTYQGFDRSISFSFRIAALSRDEMKPLYSKLNYLISQVYPDYSQKTSIMRAPLVRVTIGDYIYRMPGFLESVNVTVDNNYSWEINTNDDTDTQQLPQVLDVAISFKPIFDKLPIRETNPIKPNGLIINNNNGFLSYPKELVPQVDFRQSSQLPVESIQGPNLQPINIPGQ
jgi:hypothetical protein